MDSAICNEWINLFEMTRQPISSVLIGTLIRTTGS